MSEEILAVFAAESAETFEAIEEAIRAFEADEAGAVDRLFRHVHTLKGSAAIVGLERLEALAHAWESRLGRMRQGACHADPDCAGAMFALRERALDILESCEPRVGAEAPEAQAGKILTSEDELVLEGLDEAIAKVSAETSGHGGSGRVAGDGPAQAHEARHGVESVAAGGAAAYARVPSAKLESILSLASGIVVSLSNLEQSAREAGIPSLVDELGAVEAQAASLYRCVLDTRMVPFGDVAGRFRRAVEEIARDRGKRIRFELSGAETEIDKSLADRLAEPILHLIRNAADHGVESPEARAAAGKPPEGVVSLRARRDSGLLSIRVEDDGMGIDPEAIRARAVESGRLAADARVDAEELMGLLFEPGFSLSTEVTKWSGRGVGLDAVKRAVAALRGTVRIASEAGLGSTALIRLPLALSLVEGFVARVGELKLLVPFDAASTCLEYEDPGSSSGPFRLVEAEGRLLPSVDLAEFYGEGLRSGRRVIVVLEDGEGRTGLVADEVADTLAAAVRPLDRGLADSPGIAGYATLGDGSMVLVLDCAELGRLAARGGKRG